MDHFTNGSTIDPLICKYLEQPLSVWAGQLLTLIQGDLGLVQPGADVGQVLIKGLHLILVALERSDGERREERRADEEGRNR